MWVRVPPRAPLFFCYYTIYGAGWSSQAARRAHNPKVIGSNPVPATIFGEVAQLARACGSYPQSRGFESLPRYHKKRHIFKMCLFLFSFDKKNFNNFYHTSNTNNLLLKTYKNYNYHFTLFIK